MLDFENQKDLLGCSTVSCFAEIGGSLGVDAILSIKLGRLGATFHTTLSLIDIRSSRPILRANAKSEGPIEQQPAVIETIVNEALAALR